MKRLAYALLPVVGCAAHPALAQAELDRFDPSTVEEEQTEKTGQPGQPVKIEFEPPLLIAPQAAEPGDAAQDGSLTISSILISGNRALPDSAFVDLIERYTAEPIERGALISVADAFAQRAREKGCVFASALIPQQDLRFGLLRVKLDEGAVDEVRLEGAEDPIIQRQLSALATGQPVTKEQLERRILLADDIAGVRILDTRFEREEGRGVLIVKTRRADAWASVELRNNGSKPVGPWRARVDVDLNGVLSSGDEVDVTLRTTPFQPDELQAGRAAYRIIVDASGLELGAHLSYTTTQPGAFLSDREIEGQFWQAGFEARYPLVRRRSASLWVIGEFEVTDLEQRRAGELVRSDRVPVLRAGLYSRGRLAGGYYRGGLTASRGLEILSATQLGDPLASRSDASINFNSLFGWFGWDRSLGAGLSLGLGGRAQLATDPLLATEDIGIGGTSFLRGYNFNERLGDQGAMGFAELRYDWRGRGFWMPRGQAYVFADGGVVSNLQNGFGSGSLASAGGGLRLDLTRDLDLDLELAFPLSGERFDSESEAPLLNVRVEQSF